MSEEQTTSEINFDDEFVIEAPEGEEEEYVIIIPCNLNKIGQLFRTNKSTEFRVKRTCDDQAV
jgi:hypothetical protein